MRSQFGLQCSTAGLVLHVERLPGPAPCLGVLPLATAAAPGWTAPSGMGMAPNALHPAHPLAAPAQPPCTAAARTAALLLGLAAAAAPRCARQASGPDPTQPAGAAATHWTARGARRRAAGAGRASCREGVVGVMHASVETPSSTLAACTLRGMPAESKSYCYE